MLPIHLLLGRGAFSPENDEISRYDEQRRYFEKQIREKNTSEFCLISKKFVKQWKYFVDYYQELTEQQKESKKKPDKINADLQLNVEDKIFKYKPEDHIYNSSIRLLENEWDYEFITKEHFIFLRDKYTSIEPQVRIGIYNEIKGRKTIFPNLARFTLIYLSPDNNTFQHIKAQVDFNSDIKSWTDLLLSSFTQEFKNKQINNLRIWLPRHKNFTSDLVIPNLLTQKKVDGDIIQSYLLINQLQLKRDNCLILDFSLTQWQFSKLDQELCLKNDTNLLYSRAKYGCGQSICDFPQCKVNNGFQELELGDDDIRGICEQQAEGEDIDWELICQMRNGDEPIPFYSQTINADPIKAVTKLSQNLNIFGASFVENYSIKQGIYKVNQKIPDIDTDLIKKVQSQPAVNKSMNQIIINLFSQKDKYQEPLNNLYQLRALFIILQFRKYFDSLIDDKIIKLLINIIRRLDKKQKNQLSKWFLHVSVVELEETVKAIKKQINLELIRQQTSQIMSFLEIDDAQKIQGLFEYLQIIYRSNQTKQRILSSEFIFDYMKCVYKQEADKEEFSQFKYFQDKQWKHYTFTFCQYPWSLPIEFRSKLLSLDCKVKQHDSLKRTMYRQYEFMGQIPYLNLQIERNNIIESAIKQLNQTHIPLKNPLKVQFVGEQGVDEGGPKREFFRLIMEKLISLDYGMFLEKNNGTILWFNPQSFEMPIYYSLIGKLLGLSIYNQVLLDVRFPTVLFKKLQNEKIREEDIKELDMDVYAGFEFLREQNDPEIIKSLSLNFEATYTVWGQYHFDELKPNGSKIPVTQENKNEYIKLYTDWYLNKLVAKQFDLLSSGFKSVVDGDGIKLFSGEELQALVIGLPHFDLRDLEMTTKYDGYEEKSEYIKYFWNYIHSLSLEMQKRFLFFCTGSDRIPVGGLKSMKFIIQKHGEDTEQLPSAHTCYNVLLLPYYKNYEKLKEKFKISLENAEGFGLM